MLSPRVFRRRITPPPNRPTIERRSSTGTPPFTPRASVDPEETVPSQVFRTPPSKNRPRSTYSFSPFTHANSSASSNAGKTNASKSYAGKSGGLVLVPNAQPSGWGRRVFFLLVSLSCLLGLSTIYNRLYMMYVMEDSNRSQELQEIVSEKFRYLMDKEVNVAIKRLDLKLFELYSRSEYFLEATKRACGNPAEKGRPCVLVKDEESSFIGIPLALPSLGAYVLRSGTSTGMNTGLHSTFRNFVAEKSFPITDRWRKAYTPVSQPPDVVLSSDPVVPGHCFSSAVPSQVEVGFPFTLSSEHLFLELEHVRWVNERSKPRDVEIFARNATATVFLQAFRWEAGALKTHISITGLATPFKFTSLQLRIKSSFGAPFTCLYRLRLFQDVSALSDEFPDSIV